MIGLDAPHRRIEMRYGAIAQNPVEEIILGKFLDELAVGPRAALGA